MLGIMSFRAYLFIALIVSGILFCIYQFDTARVFVNFVEQQRGIAASALGAQVADFVVVPVRWAVTDILGVVSAGLLWPLAAIWLGLFIFMFIFNIFAPTFNAATNLPS